MALYTQKFIAADYLARVQTQTHFFLRPLVRFAGKEKNERGESSEGSATEEGRGLMKETAECDPLGDEQAIPRAREQKSPRRRVRVVELSARSFPSISPLILLSALPVHPRFSAFESRGSWGFPGKDVHRFLLSDRPFEQQPTWQSEHPVVRSTLLCPRFPSLPHSHPSSFFPLSLPDLVAHYARVFNYTIPDLSRSACRGFMRLPGKIRCYWSKVTKAKGKRERG